MSQERRDLRNAAFYLAALVALGCGLVIGGVLSAQRVDAGAAMQTIASVFDGDDEQAPTRLSIAVERAREVRAALERPIPPPAPLPPITATVAYGHFKPGHRAANAATVTRASRLPKEALDAMASAEPPTAASRSRAPVSLPRVELHRVY